MCVCVCVCGGWGGPNMGGPKHGGRFSTVKVQDVIPDPGALNSCMRTFPKNRQWIWYGLAHNSVYLDAGFKTLDSKSLEFEGLFR